MAYYAKRYEKQNLEKIMKKQKNNWFDAKEFGWEVIWDHQTEIKAKTKDDKIVTNSDKVEGSQTKNSASGGWAGGEAVAEAANHQKTAVQMLQFYH